MMNIDVTELQNISRLVRFQKQTLKNVRSFGSVVQAHNQKISINNFVSFSMTFY